MKTGLRLLLTVLALVTGAHASLAQSMPGIAAAGQQSVLYWPAIPGTNIAILQSTTNLASPNWVTANDAVAVTAATVSNTSPARFFRLIYTNPPAGMVLIPAGPFTIGNSIGDSDITNAIPTNVYVSAFYMETNLVTYSLWQAVFNAGITLYGYGFVHAGTGKGATYPAESVDWYDCVKWCNARSQLTGLTPVYYTDAGFTQVYKTGETNDIYVNWAANGFRLPTEAEWEKAARGGLNGRRFPWGNRIDENQANYYGDTTNYSYDFGPTGYNALGNTNTSPVGSFDVNGYGLYDMAGNVFEYCWDRYAAPPYPAGSPYLGGTDPRGPAMGSERVVRGGSWIYSATLARCAFRAGVPPYGSGAFGLRCVRKQ